jgi:serine/threonine protein kinase
MNGKWKNLGAGLLVRDKYRLMRAVKPGGGGPSFSALQAGTKKIFQVRFFSEREIPDEMTLAFRVKKAQKAREICGESVILPVEFGFFQEVPFVVYDLAKISSVEELLEPGQPVGDDRALRSFADALLKMLEAAHGEGIVHLGLSPLSVCWKGGKIGSGGLAVLDFGLAYFSGPSYFTYPGSVDPDLIPVAAYAAPEQAAGNEKPDHRTDLYAAGALFYRLATGNPPFAGSNSGQVLDSVVFGEPPMFADGAAGSGAALDRFFRRALNKNPFERFQSAAAMREAMLGAMSSLEIGQARGPEERKDSGSPPAIRAEGRAAKSASRGEAAGKTPRPAAAGNVLGMKPSEVSTLPPTPKEPGELQLVAPFAAKDRKARGEEKSSAWTWIAFMVILVGLVSGVLYFSFFKNLKGAVHQPPSGVAPAAPAPSPGVSKGGAEPGRADVNQASDVQEAQGGAVSVPGLADSGSGAAGIEEKTPEIVGTSEAGEDQSADSKKKKTHKKKKKTEEEVEGKIPSGINYVD